MGVVVGGGGGAFHEVSLGEGRSEYLTTRNVDCWQTIFLSKFSRD